MSKPQYKHFKTETVGDVTLFRLVDPKLSETLIVNELEDEMLSAIQEHQPKKLVISFDGVTHCSTAVINGLLRAKKRVVSEDGQLKLCDMSDPVREGYRMLNLDGTVFEIHDSKAEALAAF